MQIVIESDRSAVQYVSYSVHSQKPINASIVFDLSHEHLYVATLTKVYTAAYLWCCHSILYTDCVVLFCCCSLLFTDVIFMLFVDFFVLINSWDFSLRVFWSGFSAVRSLSVPQR